MRILRTLAVLVSVLGLLTVTSPAALAAPGDGDAGASGSVPAGFPSSLRQYVAGTSQFHAAPWSRACAAGGSSTTPTRIGSSQITNQGATSGGVDVGMYLTAIAPHLNELAWWAQSSAQRQAAWREHSLGAGYPGDAAAATQTPSWLPTSPALTTGTGPDYPSGFCSSELTGWGAAGSATSGAGVSFATGLDDTSRQWILAHAGQLRSWGSAGNITVLSLGWSDCSAADKGAFCSLAYFLNCDGTASPAATASCAAWNAAVFGEIQRESSYAARHESLLGRLGDFFDDLAGGTAAAVAGVASFFSGIWHAAAAIVDFVKDPAGEFDKFVNELKQDVISLVTAVLQGYNNASTFDPRSGGFLDHYAVMMGLGLVLCAFMFLGALRSAQDTGDREKAKGIARRLAMTVGLMGWVPLLFCWLADGVSTGSTAIIANWTGGAMGGALAKLTALNEVTSSIPGGAIAGFVIFLAMLIGAFALWVGLQVQRFGLEVGATLFALVMGVYVHPRFAARVSKAFWVIIGLFLAKPLTMIVLGAAFGVIGDNTTLTGSPSQVLGGMTLAAVGLVICGFTPFAALKWAPILPTGAASHDHSSGGAAITGAVLGSAGNSLAYSARGSGSTSARTAAGSNAPTTTGGGSATELEASVANRPAGDTHLSTPAKSAGAGSATGGGTVVGAANASAATGGTAGAAGAGKAAASAGAAVGTAGVSAAVQAATAAASTAVGKAKNLGHRHVPDADMDDEKGL